ncbi:MAG TPA: DUF4403 family protein [Saprospiraceae bacterium]|nr:DUF4403 family protein [Saprospiraceae bacterium]
MVLNTDCSSIQVEILLDESWLDKMLDEHNMDIPINEKIVLNNLQVNLQEGRLNVLADLKDKDGSGIEVTTRPVWDAAAQRITINDLKLKTDTKNVFLKSAGLFANVFLNSTIDRKLEDQANLMYTKQLEKLKSKPVEIPLPKGGTATIQISGITIHALDFISQAIRVKATIDSYWNLHLTASDQP